MKNLKDTIIEKLVINKNTKIEKYHYHPKTNEELIQTVYKLIKERGKDADLNDIDTSEITDMSTVFSDNDVNKGFNGNISEWDVSNVKVMTEMFLGSKFTGKNGDISNWDVRNVEDMFQMFAYSYFNGDISKWNISNVKNMKHMFHGGELEDNPPQWYKK